MVRSGVGVMAFVLAGGLVSVAHAQTGAQPGAAPPLMPTRDVVVAYAVQPDGAPAPQLVKVWFQGGGGLMRIDGPPLPDGSGSGDMVMNRQSRSMIVVLNQPRVFMDVPEGEEVRSPFVLDASMRFTPVGRSSVAGVGCTDYAVVTGPGPAKACVTADGVVLSESGVDGQGNRGSLVAQTVQYGPLAPSVFAPPAGFQKVARPTAPGAMGGPPGSSDPSQGPMLMPSGHP